ncbi:MAG: hypothetical protein PHT27_08125, partial [Candidatus Izemoplasmatales bacterium]|nr:hypothetical protein [Candidatus Izemoplasmatales bacterium]
DNMLIKEINAGNSELKLKLKNTAPGAADVLVDLSLLKNGKQVLSKKITGKIDKKGVLSTSYNSLRPGTYTVNIVTRAAAGKKEECREFSFPLSLHDPNGFNMTTWPAEDHENVLYISSNIPQHFFVVLSNNSKTKNAISNIQFDIPECFELIVPKDINIEGYYKTYLDAATSSISKIKRGNTTFDRYTISLNSPLPKTDLEKLQFHQGMLLFIKLKNIHDLKGKENYEIYYKLLSDIETDQENCLKVVVFPEIRGKQPKSIKIIMETWACRSNLEQWEALMKAYQTIGVNSIQWSAWSNADKTYSDIAISNKMTLFSGMFYFYSNKKYLAEKPDCAAITFTGEKAKDSMICPTVMLADDAVIYKEMMKPFVNKWVKTNIAGVDWDLEGPRPWQTCFCKRCIDKFKKHIGIKEKENLTPSQIKDKYASAWVDFCCSQNTEACFILKEELNKHNISLGVYSSTSIPFAKNSYRIDWNELINHQAIDIAFLSFYSAAPSNLGTQFTGLLKNLIKNFKARSKYPLKCYTTLTTGYGRNQLVVRPPELTKLQILKSIAHGADGVTFWHWAANDGRHYRAIAEATQIIADFEDYFLTGKNEDELVKLSGAEDVSYSVWTKDGSRVIFVFNHSKTEKTVTIHNLNLSEDKVSAWNYSEKKDISIKDMNLTIKPLDVGIVLVRSGK